MENEYAGMSPYNYSFNNPVKWNDLNGMQPGSQDETWHPPLAIPGESGSPKLSFNRDFTFYGTIVELDEVEIIDSRLGLENQNLLSENYSSLNLLLPEVSSYMELHFETRYQNFVKSKAELKNSANLKYNSKNQILDLETSKWADSEFLKSSSGTIFFKAINTAIEAFDLVEMGMEMSKKPGEGSLTVPLPPHLMAINAIGQIVARREALQRDLKFLSLSYESHGYKGISNELNSTTMGERLGLMAGFITEETFNKIMESESTSINLKETDITIFKRLSESDQPIDHDNGEIYPYMIIFPTGSYHINSFVLLPTNH